MIVYIVQQPSTRSADMILQKVTQDEDEDFYALSQDSHWQLTNSGEFCLHVIAEYIQLTS
jgi:hypothetical protein